MHLGAAEKVRHEIIILIISKKDSEFSCSSLQLEGEKCSVISILYLLYYNYRSKNPRLLFQTYYHVKISFKKFFVNESF